MPKKKKNKVLGYVRRGDLDDGPTQIRGGYSQKGHSIVLLKLKDIHDGYRHLEYFLPLDIRKPSGRPLH